MNVPSTERQRRLETLQRWALRLERLGERLERENQRFFWLRLGTLLGGGLAVFLAFFLAPSWLAWLILVVAVLAFGVVVAFHRRSDEALLRLRIAQRLAATQAARMQLDWERIPEPPGAAGGMDQTLREHPFAFDLDLAGKRSLHRLLDTAVSLGGSQRLLGWLLNPAPEPEVVDRRQALLAELIPLSGFRDRLAMRGERILGPGRARWEGDRLLKWLRMRAGRPDLRPVLALVSLLALVNLALIAAGVLGRLPPVWMLSSALYLVVYMARYRDFNELFDEAYTLGKSLRQLRLVLETLENYPYPSGSRLADLARPFWEAQSCPSRSMSRLSRIISAASLKNNMLIWAPVNALVPWDLYFAHRLNQCRQELEGLLPTWLDAWYELEALNSLANFGYLNPDTTFPELIPPETGEDRQGAGDQLVFSARRLGHPLIPYERRVSNDFDIERLGQVTLITGSNMSGKSTFLRTLGVNLVLAYAGAPVAARFLRTRPFRLFTCIHVSDSLSDGISYFYAEVRRLKALLVELQRAGEVGHDGAQSAAGYPIFYLIDEIFRGTNNREREIGSRAYVRALAGAYGTGVISTHDLELVHLAEEFPGIRNFHFREEVLGERLAFDYRLRPGPCPTTNALKIMEMEGLPVNG